MNRRGTIILLLVVVLLAAWLALTRSGVLTIGGEEEEEEESPFSTLSLFEEAQLDTVVGFSIIHNDTAQQFAAEFGELSWEVSESVSEMEEGLVVDVPRLDAAARSLTTLTSTRQISSLENLSGFGLEAARYTVTFRTLGGQEFTFNIGDETPPGTHYYVQLENEQTIHLVGTSSLDTFIDFLDDAPFAEPTPTPEPLPTSES